jgi:hypothetical protein
VPHAAPAPAPPLRTPRWTPPCLSTSRRRRPSRHARRQARQLLLSRPSLLLDPEHVLKLPTHSLLLSRVCISTAISSPELSTSPDLRRGLGSPSTATAAASHPRSSTPRAPPRPTEAHKPTQFHSLAPKRPDHYAGELELPPPLGLAVVPSIHCLLAPAKHTTRTTSSRGSCLATSPPLSCPPATRTLTMSLGPPPPAPVRRRYVASAPLFPNTGHPRDRQSATLDDGDYELVPEDEQRISEDPANIVETLTEIPNQSSKVSDIPAPSPAQEGKPRCITRYLKLLHLYSFILMYLYYALGQGVEMEP